MQTKRTIAVALAGAGLAGALSVSGATSAGAVTPAEPQQPAQQVKQVGTQGMTFYDDFWTLDGCQTAGEWGVANKGWTIYDCQESPWDWDLYYDK